MAYFRLASLILFLGLSFLLVLQSSAVPQPVGDDLTDSNTTDLILPPPHHHHPPPPPPHHHHPPPPEPLDVRSPVDDGSDATKYYSPPPGGRHHHHPPEPVAPSPDLSPSLRARDEDSSEDSGFYIPPNCDHTKIGCPPCPGRCPPRYLLAKRDEKVAMLKRQLPPPHWWFSEEARCISPFLVCHITSADKASANTWHLKRDLEARDQVLMELSLTLQAMIRMLSVCHTDAISGMDHTDMENICTGTASPYDDTSYGGGAGRLTEKELYLSLLWLNLYALRPSHLSPPSTRNVLGFDNIEYSPDIAISSAYLDSLSRVYSKEGGKAKSLHYPYRLNRHDDAQVWVEDTCEAGLREGLYSGSQMSEWCSGVKSLIQQEDGAMKALQALQNYGGMI